MSSIGSNSKTSDHFSLHRTYLRNKKTPFNIYKNCYHPKYYKGGSSIPKRPLNPFKFDLNFFYFPLYSEKKYFLYAVFFFIASPFIKIFRILFIYLKNYFINILIYINSILIAIKIKTKKGPINHNI